MTSTSDMVCPKCRGRMGSYERSGIVVDQCEDCRGMFLDKGELERMVDIEGGGWSGMVGPPAERARSGPLGRPHESGDDAASRQQHGPGARRVIRAGMAPGRSVRPGTIR